MISLCILTRNNLIYPIVEYFDKLCKKHNIKYEICIGDNSYVFTIQALNYDKSDEYIKITDKELFRGGIPAAHNRIATECANSYKIFYLDSDEFPIWINPDLENMYDITYIPTTLRADFCTTEEIEQFFKEVSDFENAMDVVKYLEKKGKQIVQQDRLYNCRYAKFEGVCHSIFHVSQSFRSKKIGAIICHSNTVRDTHKREEYTNPVIYEQYMRQNINPYLASSDRVLEWGKKIKNHKYKDWREFVNEIRT